MISVGINILVLILLIALLSKIDELSRAVRELQPKPPAEDGPAEGEA